MKCPVCKSEELTVRDSRPTTANRVRRRRCCGSCGHKFNTYEAVIASDVPVIKRDGSRQPFETGKLRLSIEMACHKRGLSSEAISGATDSVVRYLNARGQEQFTTRFIGESVLAELRNLDHVAYVRYKSIFDSFQSVDDFRAVARAARIRNIIE